MDCDEILNIDMDEDLLTELPDNNDATSLLDEIKNDSGLGVCDSMDQTTNSVENFNYESNDSVIGKHEMPELHAMPTLQSMETADFPMPELIPLSHEENVQHTNTEMKQLPQLFPIPAAMLDEVTTKVEDNSRRSSTSSSLLDSLLDKIRRNTTESTASSERSPLKPQVKSCATSDDDLLIELNTPVEMMKNSNPNMLATPIVKNQKVSSAFVTSDEDYEKAIAKTKHKRLSEESDRSKMTARSQPPKMNAPKMPTNIQQPRTLAEKRALVSKNIDFLMIEQESKIFKQIQRKNAGMGLNYNLIETIANEDIPIKQGSWKALSWLRTKEGNYIQQYIDIDGQMFKLAGSVGNHRNKILPKQSNKPFEKFRQTSLRSIRCCEGGKIKKRIIDNLVNMESIRKFVLEESIDAFKKLEDKNLSRQLCSIKPRPLCKKIKFINENRKMFMSDEDSAFLGDFSKFEMPDIKLEVTVGNKIPLHSVAKQYLNEIIPYRDMNENWINFSLSALKCDEENCKKFEFKIPYENNKKHLLVREILKSKEDTEKLRIFDQNGDDEDDMEWTFCKNADKNDKIEMEIVEIIKDLTNSVFVNLNDDLFTKEDEIDKNAAYVAPVKTREELEGLSSISKNEKSKKVLLELRRLNANVVKTEAPRVDDEEIIRRHATAHLAKDEKELRATVIVTDSDTVLLTNKEKESRRQKKMPKKYSDYLHDESFVQDPPPQFKRLKQPKELQDELFKAKVHAQPKPQPATVCNDPIYSLEELKTVKKEVNKWLHVNVDIRKLEHLENIQIYCMLHNLYKCGCKEIHHITKPIENDNRKSLDSSAASSRAQSVETCTSRDERSSRAQSFESSSQDLEISRRVLPVERKQAILRSINVLESFDDAPNSPKIEVVNISELINGGIGPIFINIYDTKINRLNQIFRTILNNKSALVYIDGLSYFIDTKRLDVTKLKFDSISDDLDHPIFILQQKYENSTITENLNGCHDFMNLLFNENSELAIEIKDKMMLKQIGDVIESILQSVRRKIEQQFDSEPNDLVKEQLSMITRDRSNSDSSNSSSMTDPLIFYGQYIKRAPEPGHNTPVMKEFNKIFSIRMQRLCAIIKSNSLGLRCLDGQNNKFYLYRWDLLLKSLEEELIEIWQAKLIGESGKIYYMMALTDSPKPPNIEHAVDVKNIKFLSLSNHMTELTRMILLKSENAKTKHMTILLYGCQGYFRICGIMNSKENYFDGIVAKPTRSTHPRLTAKIQKVYNIWYGLRKERERKNSEKRNVEKIENKRQEEEKKKNLKDENLKNVNGNANENSVQNVRPLIQKSLTKTSQPSTYKWFLLNISNDFSDVFIKHWNRYLNYKVIMESVQKAKNKRKAIQLVSNNSFKWPKIYALPSAPLKFKIHEHETMSDNFLLFGPYLRSSSSYLLLMQNVDGKMYTRDYYEKLNGIKRSSRTRCLWIYANNLKCISDVSAEMITLTKLNRQTRENQDVVETIKIDSDDEEVDDAQSLKISTVVGGFQEVL
ncbi:hypothetical protein PVAND_015234 [Polypedilum vanderplanki]|uniref:Uncharacterized protein n=1 Tax=Polypedilum vanderplanki TaxID=319348 RepID=A0A9J6BBN8_POLVA|nr:hypothetical protein PVAND_015234 [Polypedilum vanderplanki]